MKIKFWQILFLSVCIFSFQNKEKSISRINEPELFAAAKHKIPHLINFQDTIPNDTLFEFVDKNNQPLYYSRKILSGVCVSGECRLVNIHLFWTITGRYLGFEMPPGEFLSRAKHKPFFPDDYDRLNTLLGDPLSPLAHYSINDLVPPVDSSKAKVDAVTSATIAAVLDYIVKGAVYTTYTLWHIVYGQTKREVEHITAQRLTPQLTMQLLNSKNVDDQVWALNHIPGKIEIDQKLLNKIMENIAGKDVYLAERSLNVLPPEILNNENVQEQLGDIFAHSGFLQQRLILEKLKAAPSLHPVLLHQLSGELDETNGILIKLMMELFIKKKVNDNTVVADARQLLKHDNRYIANQALKYLETLDNTDRKTERSIEKFKRKHL